MSPLLDRIPLLPINLVLGTLAFYLMARIYILPKLKLLAPETILLPILLLHSFRHLGLMFLTPGATYAGLPPDFAYPAALGDLVACLLAFIAIPLVLRGLPAARPVLWALTVEGTLDLVSVIALAAASNAPAFMGPTYWIPALYVPALLVTHYLTVLILIGDGKNRRD